MKVYPACVRFLINVFPVPPSLPSQLILKSSPGTERLSIQMWPSCGLEFSMEERKTPCVLPISFSTFPSELVARGHGACLMAAVFVPSVTAVMSWLVELWMWAHPV